MTSHPPSRPSRPWLPRAIVWASLALVHAGLAVLFLTDRSPGTAAACTGLPLDDAWIHMVYGRSVAQTGWPCYNDGEPEAGFTSPLWMFVTAAAHGMAWLLRADAVLVVKCLGVLIAWSATLGVYELTRRYTRDIPGAVLAALLSALTPALAFSQVSGMEPCLAAAAGLWAVYALERERYGAAGLLLAAAVWSRPEMVMVGLLVAVAVITWRERVLGREKHGAMLWVIGPGIVATAVWSAYCVAVTGFPLPNTFYVKFNASQPGNLATMLREQLWWQPANAYAAGLVLYMIGAWVTLQRGKGMLTRSTARTGDPAGQGMLTRSTAKACHPAAKAGHPAIWIVALVFPWVFVAAIAFTRTMTPGTGRYFYWLRYVVPVLPFLYVTVGIGWRWLWDLGGAGAAKQPVPRSTGRAAMIAARAAAVLLALVAFWHYPATLAAERRQFAWNCQNMNEVQVALGQWVAEHTPPTAVIALHDAGAIRYFGRRRTIDLIGLNYYPLAHDTARWLAMSQTAAGLEAFLRGVPAQYMISFPSWFPAFGDPEADQRFQIIHYAQSQNNTISPSPAEMMVVCVPRAGG